MNPWYIEHSAKGTTWKKHKYVKKMNVNGKERYFYGENSTREPSKTKVYNTDSSGNQTAKKVQVFNNKQTKSSKSKNTHPLLEVPDKLFNEDKVKKRNTSLWAQVKLKSKETKEVSKDGMEILNSLLHMKKK